MSLALFLVPFPSSPCRWGTQKTRIGTDSQQPFGYCCLTLKPVVDPVVRYEMKADWKGMVRGMLVGSVDIVIVPAGECWYASGILVFINFPPPLPPPFSGSPSGHVYSREAIVEYLLAKTQELKQQRLVYKVRHYLLWRGFPLLVLFPSFSCVGPTLAHHVHGTSFIAMHTHTHAQFCSNKSIANTTRRKLHWKTRGRRRPSVSSRSRWRPLRQGP